MKTIKNIFFIIILVLMTTNSSLTGMDTLAKVILYNSIKTSSQTLDFSIYLRCLSNKWNAWANGTFQLELPDYKDEINKNNFSIEIVNDTNEFSDPKIIMLPTNDYSYKLLIKDNSFIINIFGPEKYEDCIFIPKDSTISLARLRIINNSLESITDNISWKQPLYIYQACAYKAENDSIIDNNLLWFKHNDNIEMTDRLGTSICDYIIEKMPPPEFTLNYFHAQYIGNSIAEIQWETKSEASNNGFTLTRLRSEYNLNYYEPSTLDTIDTYKTNQNLIGCQNYKGKEYQVILDNIPIAGLKYLYILQYTDYDGNYLAIDTADIFIPRSIINYAQATPNPFHEETTIEYITEDDVILDAKLYDLTGKVIVNFFDDEHISKGIHTIHISKNDLHSSGVYELIFIAKPVDPAKEYTNKVVIKLHFLK